MFANPFLWKKNKKSEQNFFLFVTSEGVRPPNFGVHFLGAVKEIYKMHRWRKLYCHKVQYDTPYDQIGPTVLDIGAGATGFGPSTSYILVYSVNALSYWVEIWYGGLLWLSTLHIDQELKSAPPNPLKPP